MNFFSRFGYLVAVFFVVALFISDGVGAAFHLSSEATGVLTFLFWGPPCIYCGRTLDHPGKRSNFFGLRLDYWGYGLIVFGLLYAYLNWSGLARNWVAVVWEGDRPPGQALQRNAMTDLGLEARHA